MIARTALVFLIEVIVLVTLLASSCSSVRQPFGGGMGAHFVESFPVAQRTCDASLSEQVLGKTVTVHYASALGADTARRFLLELRAFQAERENDYEILRSGLKSHLGDALFAKIANRPFLHARELEVEWYLLQGKQPTAMLWKDPAGSRWHFVSARPDGTYADDDLRVRSGLNMEVHELTHWTLWSLRTSKAHLPRWFEEGTSDFMSMQFQRWKEKKWDQNREIMARLMWDRLAVREHLFSLPDFNRGNIARYHAFRLPEWEADLLYKGSLGLVFAMDADLGTGGLVNFYRELLTKTPEGDRAVIATIEHKIGKPIRAIGLMPKEARQRIYSTLMERAATECESGGPSQAELPLSALGHFPEAAETVVPVLQALAQCPVPNVAIEGIVGLRYLGRIEPLAETVGRLRRSGDATLLAALEEDGNLETAEEFLSSGSNGARWFESEREIPSASLRRPPAAAPVQE